MEREEAIKLFHAITGNMKDAVMQGEQFVDEWLEKEKFHLITADGVTVKDPEQIVYKVNPSSWGTSQPKAKNVQPVSDQCTMKVFSTEDSRFQWILRNKPILSLNEIDDAITDTWSTVHQQHRATLYRAIAEMVEKKMKELVNKLR